MGKQPAKSLLQLTDDHKKQLAKYMFPRLEASELELAWKEVALCIMGEKNYEVSFSQLLRGRIWCRQHGFAVPDNTPVETSKN